MRAARLRLRGAGAELVRPISAWAKDRQTLQPWQRSLSFSVGKLAGPGGYVQEAGASGARLPGSALTEAGVGADGETAPPDALAARDRSFTAANGERGGQSRRSTSGP
jgi:hypothetical protein